MKNLPKEKRDRLVLVVLSALIVLIALWQGVIKMQSKSLDNLTRTLTDEETKFKNGERLVNSVETFKQDIKTKSAELKEKELAMASGDMYSWMVMKLNQFKVGYNVEIPQISREVTKDVELFPKFPYKAAQFTVRGSAFYHDFGRFLADFENSFPFVQVKNIVLEPLEAGSSANQSETGEKSEKLSFRMEIVTLVNPTVQ